MLAKVQLSPTEWEGEIELLSSNLARGRQSIENGVIGYISLAGLLLQVRPQTYSAHLVFGLDLAQPHYQRHVHFRTCPIRSALSFRPYDYTTITIRPRPR